MVGPQADFSPGLLSALLEVSTLLLDEGRF